MRVLTSEAVADPTALERQVNKAILARKEAHFRENDARRVSREDRHEHEAAKLAELERVGGVQGACFKVRFLSHQLHQAKVFQNAKQHKLSGVVINHPSFVLVFVEGAAKSIKAYKRLMLVRMRWTENPSLDAFVGATDQANDEDDDMPDQQTSESVEPSKTDETSVKEKPQDLTDNYCHLIWEGPLLERSFRYFRAETCPTDRVAKDLLGSSLAGIWDLATKEHLALEDA